VDLASVHKGQSGQHVADRLAQGLRAIDDEEQSSVGGKAPLDQIAQQAFATELFSVEPSQSPRTCFVPSVATPRASSTQWSAYGLKSPVELS